MVYVFESFLNPYLLPGVLAAGGYLLLIVFVLSRARARGATPWPILFFLGMLFIEGWLAMILVMSGDVYLHAREIHITGLYVAGLVAASVAAPLGAIAGLGMPNAVRGNTVPPKVLLSSVILLATLAVIMHFVANRSVLFGGALFNLDLTTFLVEMRRGITKYSEVGRDWAGQGAIASVLYVQGLIIGTYCGFRFARVNRYRPWKTVALLLFAVLCVALDGTRGRLLDLALVVMVGTSVGKMSITARLRARTITLSLIAAGIIALTVLTKIDLSKISDAGDLTATVARQSALRLILGDAVHDFQTAELMVDGALGDAYRFQELRGQLLSPLPGDPPERLSRKLHNVEMGRAYSTSYWSTTEIGRRLYDFGIVAVAIGFFLQGLLTAYASRIAGTREPGTGDFVFWSVSAVLLATASGIASVIPDLSITVATIMFAWFAWRVLPRRRRIL